MSYKDIIDSAKDILANSLEIIKLEEAIEDLEKLLLEKDLFENYFQTAEKALSRLKAKYFALKYYDGYFESDYNAMKECLELSIPILETKEDVSGSVLFKKLLQTSSVVKTVMDVLIIELKRVRDDELSLTTSSIEDLETVKSKIIESIDTISAIEDTQELFKKAVRMIDLKSKVLKDLEVELDWVNDNIAKLNSSKMEIFFKSDSKPLEDVEGEKIFEIIPDMPDAEKILANTLVLSSPFKDEVILYVRAYSEHFNKKFIVFDANAFADKNTDYIDNLFQVIKSKNLNCLIFGLPFYHDPNKQYLLEMILRTSKEGIVFLTVDSVGDRGLYDSFYKIAKERNTISVMDVSYIYLKVPSYAFTRTLLEDRNMITAIDYEFIRTNFAFMGYVGLNKILSAYAQGKIWKDYGIELSSLHLQEMGNYAKNLPSQELLIDYGWIDLQIQDSYKKTSKEFDYDTIREANPENIKKILSSNLTFFQKCGSVIRYCLLCGEDVSVWRGLSCEKKSQRITDATRLIANILQNEYEPEVKVVPEEEWTNKSAGGLCCDGGKLILYREDCCDGYDWMADAVAHECFHGFQHTVEYQGWQEWHWKELGVTKGRVGMWRDNSAQYIEISKNKKAYLNQIIESDARAFAADCLSEDGASIWNIIDWE